MLSACIDTELSKADLKVIYNEVYNERAEWKFIGLELNLTSGDIDAIERRPSHNRDIDKDRLMEVLQIWLSKERATWRQLIRALRSQTVDKEKKARTLEEKYCPQGRPPTLGYILCVLFIMICRCTQN